ncbi:phytanoyl-coa alpha-hydroxylase [Holotrichia oblita]|uniref:Phytanoyl-coa alpha-hydroxylase n=1 Tax=Holotrichia oblita TaxID=644536 RepID=A0ACB9TKJ6_HOLOL|nr:phytanoyl-coa alpha-hydroxylase [Holotrichia oblita]
MNNARNNQIARNIYKKILVKKITRKDTPEVPRQSTKKEADIRREGTASTSVREERSQTIQLNGELQNVLDSVQRYPQKFKYTKNNTFLTDEQRKFYEENGFIVFKKLISDEILNQCFLYLPIRQRFVDICTKKIAPQGNTILMKDLELAKKGKTAEYLYYKINDFLYDDVFIQYAACKELLDIVSSIIGNNITATHSMLINKPPGSSSDASRHPMHQDQYYFPFGPPEHVVAAWTALETINEENGCLFVLPGTHTGKLYLHDYPKINDFLYDDVFIQYAACKELLDIVSSIIGNNITATHSMLINKPPGSSSDASRHPMHQDQYYFPFGPPEHVVAAWTALETINEENGCLFVLPGTHTGKLYLHDYPKGFRRAISVHYVDTNCEFFDFKETTRENIAHEIVQMFAKKGVKLSYQDIWKYKGRLIRGPPGNFQKYTSRL